MDILQTIYETVKPALPTAAALVVSIVVIYVVRAIMAKRTGGIGSANYGRQMITLLMVFAAIVVVILVWPMSDHSKGQLLSLIGILLTAAIALSSTTFLGNIMAGLMLRAVRNFRPGDFIRVGDHFGRVSEQGLFHVEIQTEDRDLTTMPNLYLVTNPVKVIRPSGTVISAEVSLGYNDSRKTVEKLLIKAAEDAGLTDAFVWILNLGDYSVTYRIAGLLPEARHVLSTRSRLQKKMLDALHGGGVEIVSPTFMNTRALSPREPVVPDSRLDRFTPEPAEGSVPPEAVVFDKANEAESLEKLKERYQGLVEQLDAVKKKHDDDNDLLSRDELKAEREQIEARKERLAEYIKRREKKEEED